ncbi:MAG TPA: SPOR domain-containing protein [Moheibacter sp.]|nr:SPOR domain-containing protein [Moheibacter sp.]
MMKKKYLGFSLLVSGILLGQSNVITSQYGDLTIEWEKSLEQLMIEKESCTPPSDPPKETPEFCRGARIQIFYSKNRTEAEQKLNEVKSQFPSEFSNLEYNSPDYKIKMGYFESRETAQSVLNKARRYFPSALIVEEVIRCSLID